MPFGKHKNKPIRDVPTSYLHWLAIECDLDASLRSQVERELLGRGVNPECFSQRTNREAGKPGPRRDATHSPLAEMRSVFKTWFAGLARDFHPDRIGGDGREMKVLNEAAERLRKLLEVT
jgi:hypothetical protein